MKTTVIKYWGCVAALCGMLCTTACSDEPDAEHYYTFTGQMMSEYLNSSEDFSEFRRTGGTLRHALLVWLIHLLRTHQRSRI